MSLKNKLAKAKAEKTTEERDPDTIDFETNKTDNEQKEPIEHPSGFNIETNVPMPEKERKARKNKYPFNDLLIGQSFFVPNTEDMPDAFKAMSSTVSSANRRHRNKDGSYKKRFELARAKGRNGLAGVRVWRVRP